MEDSLSLLLKVQEANIKVRESVTVDENVQGISVDAKVGRKAYTPSIRTDSGLSRI